MLEIQCTGTPYEVGHSHGIQAKKAVLGSIAVYKMLFQKTCSLNWDQVLEEASKFVEPLERTSGSHLEEIRGIADGAGVSFLDVLALNIRTEIMFGLWTDESPHVEPETDGCTSLSWMTKSGTSFLSQNWDWKADQIPNLVLCRVSQPGTGKPAFVIITEAGIIGKIGFNEAGVGCCLNAIRARGVNPANRPIHFALRTILESPSLSSACENIKNLGLAGSGHILVADTAGSVGLECTSSKIREISTDKKGRVIHTNHLILPHPETNEPFWLEDSPKRLERMNYLADQITDEQVDSDSLYNLYTDEQGFPAAICRKQEHPSSSQTLFNIIMNLSEKVAQVTIGRPTDSQEKVTLKL